MKINDCDCVILCGGLGKRLRSVVSDAPKVMAEVDGRPFLDFIVEYLKNQGVERVILCTGYKADLIEDYYREHDFGLVIDFSRESEPLGTGGALKNAREIISSNPFFVLNGDSFLSADFQIFLDFHTKKKSVVSVLASPAQKSKDFGSLKIDESGRIIDFCEKIESNAGSLVNAGIYCFDQEVFSCMPDSEKFSLENDLFPKLVDNEFYGYLIDKKFIDIGTPERYESAKQNLNKGKNSGN